MSDGTTTLVTGIGELVTNDPAYGDGSPLGLLRDAAILVQDNAIAWVGVAAEAPDADIRRDFGGRAIIPGFVDSHAHLVFDGDRAAEFAARMAGEPYNRRRYRDHGRRDPGGERRRAARPAGPAGRRDAPPGNDHG